MRGSAQDAAGMKKIRAVSSSLLQCGAAREREYCPIGAMAAVRRLGRLHGYGMDFPLSEFAGEQRQRYRCRAGTDILREIQWAGQAGVCGWILRVQAFAV